MEERVVKIMARAGIGSRRACDELIRQGRVTVNGEVARLGVKADVERDQIRVDGKLVWSSEQVVYIALNKPRGVLSAPEFVGGEGEKRRTVLDLVSVRERVFPVGRLDADSEGLVLLTNDGQLANYLTHPRYEHDKVYRVRLEGVPNNATLERWRQGVELEGKMTAPAKVKVLKVRGNRTWVQIVMHEGRKRQIREVGRLLGHRVLRLKRTRLGSLTLGRLEPGEWRWLSKQEVRDLKRLAEKGRRSRQRR